MTIFFHFVDKEKSRKAPRIGNRVAAEIEQKVLDYSLEFPTHGQVRVSNELRKQGIQVSAGGIRSIWVRHGLQVKSLRLKRLEEWAALRKLLRAFQPQRLSSASSFRSCRKKRRSIFGMLSTKCLWGTGRST